MMLTLNYRNNKFLPIFSIYKHPNNSFTITARKCESIEFGTGHLIDEILGRDPFRFDNNQSKLILDWVQNTPIENDTCFIRMDIY